MIVSGCGVREGLFFQHYLLKTGQQEVIADTLLHSTQNMLLFYKGDLAHATQVANLAASMFEGWQEIHHLEQRDKTLLWVASLLHDIGITINYYDHARHSAYLVENARLFGLTHREQMICAVVAGWHNGATSKYMRNSLYSKFLDDTDWINARKMALLLALAESLDSTQMGLVQKAETNCSPTSASLIVHVDEREGSIELQAIKKHRKWFKREFGLALTLQNSPIARE